MKKTLIILICVLAVALAVLLGVLGSLLSGQDTPDESTAPSQSQSQTTLPDETTAPETTVPPTTESIPPETTENLAGWVENEDGTLSYRDETGAFLTGWIETELGKYWLDEEGHPKTGWIMTDTARLYFDETGLMAVGFREVDGIERYFTSDGNYVPLVNPWNEVPADYEMNLVELEGEQVDFTCRDALLQMLIDCREAGHKCPLNSVYRSIETQEYLWNARYNNYIKEGYSAEDAKKLTWQKVAYPGTSEHHTGLAVDIIGTDEMYAWFYAHSWEYGFIVRYPEDKIDVTGIMYEPWHFRYVGKEMAKEVYDSGLTLEEYLDSIR